MSTDKHEDVTTLFNKAVLTFMGGHLDGYSIYYVIDVPQFQYYGVRIVGPEFDEDIFITVG